jgi:hypothetical protein
MNATIFKHGKGGADWLCRELDDETLTGHNPDSILNPKLEQKGAI